MDIRPLTPAYAVSPQIAASDMPAIAAAGYSAILCNRPDAEVGPDQQAAAIEAAAQAAGLTFTVLPVVHSEMTEELIAEQKAIIDTANGPVLAYCASGTRSTVVWMLGQAAQTEAQTLLEAAGQAGYALEHLRPVLEARFIG